MKFIGLIQWAFFMVATRLSIIVIELILELIMNKAIERPAKSFSSTSSTKNVVATFSGTVYTSRARQNEGVYWRREWSIKFSVEGEIFETCISRLEDFVDESKMEGFVDSEPGNFSHKVELTFAQIIPLLRNIASVYYYPKSKEAKEVLAKLLPSKQV